MIATMLILFLALTSSGSTLSAPSSAAEILARYEASVDYWYCIHGTAGIIVGTKPGSEQEVAKFFTTLGAKATCMPSQPYVAVACEDGCQDLLAPSMVQAITPLVESVEPDCIIRIQDQLTDDLPLDLIRPLVRHQAHLLACLEPTPSFAMYVHAHSKRCALYNVPSSNSSAADWDSRKCCVGLRPDRSA